VILTSITALIAKELTIPLSQVTATVTLLDDGNTIPFVTRYRDAMTSPWRVDRED
jgi:uncharacterized protein